MERKLIERKKLWVFEPVNSRSQCIHSTAVLQPLPFIVKIRPKILFALIQSRRDFFLELLRTNLRLELLLRFKIREKQNEAKKCLESNNPTLQPPPPLSLSLSLYQAHHLSFVQSKDLKRLFWNKRKQPSKPSKLFQPKTCESFFFFEKICWFCWFFWFSSKTSAAFNWILAFWWFAWCCF